MQKEQIYERLNQAYFSENHHEKEVLASLPGVLGGAATFVDVGASLGQFTFWANRHLRKAKIISIEADPVRVEELQRNCQKWQAESSNQIRVVAAALSDRAGRITFNTTNSNVSGGLSKHDLSHLTAQEQAAIQWHEIEVATCTLDELFPEPPDFVKMDIEGAELLALRGASKILACGRTVFLMEVHPFSAAAPEPGQPDNTAAVHSLMHQAGYRDFAFHGKTLFVKSPALRLPRFFFQKKINGLKHRLGFH